MKEFFPFGAISFIGIIIFIVQCAALGISETYNSHNWYYIVHIPDLVGTGIWGGAYLVVFAILGANKMLESIAIKWMAIYGALIGFTLIGLNSWSISMYSDYIADCERFILFDVSLCGRVAIDCVMIIGGICAVLINGFIYGNATSLAKKSIVQFHQYQ